MKGAGARAFMRWLATAQTRHAQQARQHALRAASFALLSVGFAVLAVSLGFSCCGYTETDMQLLRDRVELLQTMLDKCEAAARSSNAQARACRTSQAH